MLRKFTGALKRAFESSVGKMGCIDTVSGEEVLCLITLLDLFEGNSLLILDWFIIYLENV